MKKQTMLLVAVLWSGELCEAAMNVNEDLNDAKNALMVNYCLPYGAIKEWRVR